MLIKFGFSFPTAKYLLNLKVTIKLYAALNTLQTTVIYYLVLMIKHLKYGIVILPNLWPAICFIETGLTQQSFSVKTNSSYHVLETHLFKFLTAILESVWLNLI